MDIRPIRTEADHRDALARIEALWNADPGTDAGDELDVLVDLVEAYEARHYPAIAALDPIDAIREHMDLTGRTQADLTRLLELLHVHPTRPVPPRPDQTAAHQDVGQPAALERGRRRGTAPRTCIHLLTQRLVPPGGRPVAGRGVGGRPVLPQPDLPDLDQAATADRGSPAPRR